MYIIIAKTKKKLIPINRNLKNLNFVSLFALQVKVTIIVNYYGY